MQTDPRHVLESISPAERSKRHDGFSLLAHFYSQAIFLYNEADLEAALEVAKTKFPNSSREQVPRLKRDWILTRVSWVLPKRNISTLRLMWGF